MGGGGGGNNMAMMMAMQQQQDAKDQRAQQEAAAQREYQSQQDTYQHGVDENNRNYTRQQEAEAAAREAARYEQTRRDQSEYQARQDQTAAQARAQAQEDARQQRIAEQQQAEQDRVYQTQQSEAAYNRQRQADLEARQYTDSQAEAARNRQTASEAAAKAEADNKLNNWRGQRDALYTGQKSDATARLASMGVNDPNISAAIMSALNTANASIPDLASNAGGYFEGVVDKVLGQQRDAARTQYTNQYNQLLPQDFADTKVADTMDDSILEGILGEQYDSAASQAKRMLDRGAITQEGYDANLKQLDQQRNTGRSKLTTLGNNELSSERTKLGNLANQGRSAAANYELGQTYDPNSYVSKVGSAYDDWFKNLGTTLRGVAPTDLFDTSGFANTAGSISGPTNSPFVGGSNALTGASATAMETDDDKKKRQAMSGGGASMGVF